MLRSCRISICGNDNTGIDYIVCDVDAHTMTIYGRPVPISLLNDNTYLEGTSDNASFRVEYHKGALWSLVPCESRITLLTLRIKSVVNL